MTDRRVRAVVQRCSRAEVRVAGEAVGRIGRGLVVLIGVAKGDDGEVADALGSRLANLRVFEDDAGKMNRSLLDVDGEALVVSQFTLAASTNAGRRPSFDGAAPAADAEPLYQRVAERLRAAGARVETGRFGARMEVELVNDGPVTFVLDETAR